MRMVEEDLEGVRGEVREIIGRELLEGGNEVRGGVLDLRGVGVGFEFVLAREDIHEDREDARDGLENDHEEDQPNVDGAGGNAEGGVELGAEGRFGIGCHAEEEEHHGGLDDGDDEALHDVLLFEVSNFVSENGDEFIGALALDESVVERDLFPFSEAREKGVGFGGSFRAVHDGDFREREVAFFGHALDGLVELFVFERAELVEEWEDQRRCEIGEGKRDDREAQPGEDPGVVDRVKDPKNEGHDGQADEGHHEVRFDLVADVSGAGCFVESESFLQGEGMVNVEG